jgi:fluoride exporter
MLGAAVGGLVRYTVGSAIMARYGGPFPLGTVIINITGSFLIGLLMTLLTQRQAHPNWRLFLVVGVLGGYTTFSSFEWETLQEMKRGGGELVALANVVGSVVLGYLAVWLGSSIAARY